KILSSNPPDNFEHKLPTPSAPREKQQPSTKSFDLWNLRNFHRTLIARSI
ncbi:unnamed protein product, partial [Rotaria magnacalcarata]